MGNTLGQDCSQTITSITPKICIGQAWLMQWLNKVSLRQGYKSGKNKNYVPVYKIEKTIRGQNLKKAQVLIRMLI